MRKINDLSGNRYGSLVATTFAGVNYSHNAIWTCRCDCGRLVDILSTRLISGRTRSCGCRKAAITTARNKLGLIGEVPRIKNRVYRIYHGMMTRCYNKKDAHYRRYGERGISVCDEWKQSFSSFEKWALGNGYSPNLSIDRIDNDGNYSPSNCRWATAKEQSNNKTQRKSLNKQEAKQNA